MTVNMPNTRSISHLMPSDEDRRRTATGITIRR